MGNQQLSPEQGKAQRLLRKQVDCKLLAIEVVRILKGLRYSLHSIER